MATTTLTLNQLIDRTMFDLVAPGEQGLRVVIGSTELTGTTDTSLTLTDATGVNVTDVLEFGDELVLVTEKSSDPVPVLTVARSYYGTTAAAHAAGTIGLANPTHPRRRVAEAIRRSFSRLEALGLPLVTTTTLNPETDLAVVQLPVDCREVYQVLYIGTDGRAWELSKWEVFDVPTTVYSSGKIMNVSRDVDETDDLQVVYRSPYRWNSYPSDPSGTSTIQILEGAEDLPSLYAAAWLTSNREMSRLELDRSEEWNRTAQYERGTSNAVVRAKWQEFYRALDEARRLQPPPQTIHFKGRPRL